MFRVFISYRHDDDHAAGRIRERLVNQFGEESVFLDVASIDLGRDFRSEIMHWVEQSSVLLVVIGNHWLDPDETGRPRLFEEDDWVRFEIEQALQRDIPVVPLLLSSRIAMPKASSLPVSIQKFAFREACLVRANPMDFEHDVSRLCLDLMCMKEDQSRGPMLASEPGSLALKFTSPEIARAAVGELSKTLQKLGSDRAVGNVATIKHELLQAVSAAEQAWKEPQPNLGGGQPSTPAIPHAFRDICYRLREIGNRCSASCDPDVFLNLQQVIQDLQWAERQMLKAPGHDPSRYMVEARDVHEKSRALASGRPMGDLAQAAVESYGQRPMSSWTEYDDPATLHLPSGDTVFCLDLEVFCYLVATGLHRAIGGDESNVLAGTRYFHEVHRFLAAKFRDPALADLATSLTGLSRLRSWLRDLSLPPRVRDFAAYQLGVSRYIPALDSLHWAAAEDRDFEIVLWAVASLGRIEDVRSIDVLKRRLQWETDGELRTAITEAIEYICGRIPFPYAL